MTTTTKNIFRTIAISGTICCLILISGKSKKITCKTLQFPGGWGYEISSDNHVLIHQETIPGKSSSRGFKTENQARSAALLVLEKIRTTNNPTLGTAEIAAVTGE